jgi:hypothetical protein
MSPSEFEFLIHLIGAESRKRTQRSGKPFLFKRLALTLRFDKFCDTSLSPLHFTITKTLKKPHSTTDSHRSSRQKHQEWKGQRSGRWCRVTLHVQTCSGRNRIIPLMRRPLPTANRTSPYRYRVTNFRNVTWSRVPSTLSRYGVTVRCNVTSVYPPLQSCGLTYSSFCCYSFSYSPPS